MEAKEIEEEVDDILEVEKENEEEEEQMMKDDVWV